MRDDVAGPCGSVLSEGLGPDAQVWTCFHCGEVCADADAARLHFGSSEHQQPGCQSTSVADSVLEVCDGVDLLIHDAQYTDPEFAQKFDWGHCTTDYAVEVAVQAVDREKRRISLALAGAGGADEVGELPAPSGPARFGTLGDLMSKFAKKK